MGAIISGPAPFRNNLVRGSITRESSHVVARSRVFPASFVWGMPIRGTPNTRFAIWAGQASQPEEIRQVQVAAPT